MSTDDIIKLARKAGIDRERPYLPVEYREPWNSCTDAELERFAHLIRTAALREAEAECEKRLHFGDYGAAACRNAIRQLKDKL